MSKNKVIPYVNNTEMSGIWDTHSQREMSPAATVEFE